MSDEKISPEAEHLDEKHGGYENGGYDVPRRVSLAEATARRQSVALNVVVNPLKVSPSFWGAETHRPPSLDTVYRIASHLGQH